MVFVRDRASVKGRTGEEVWGQRSLICLSQTVTVNTLRTLGVVKQGHHIQGWPIAGTRSLRFVIREKCDIPGWLRLSPKCGFAEAPDKPD